MRGTFSRIRFSSVAVILGIGLMVSLIFGSLVVGAQQNISQGYVTNDQELYAGMAVSVEDGDDQTKTIQRANRSNLERFVGVVTTLDRSLLTVAGVDDQVVVASSGEVETYVSDLNGAINQGDAVTVSPLSGILVKAENGERFIVGYAASSESSEPASRQIQDNSGQERTVNIFKQLIAIDASRINDEREEEQPFLVLVGESVTGKPVNQLQVIAALTILMLIFIIEGSIIYGAIHGSLSSIGRNPLAKRAIYKQLLQVSWLTLLVLVFGLGAIYVILWA